MTGTVIPDLIRDLNIAQQDAESPARRQAFSMTVVIALLSLETVNIGTELSNVLVQFLNATVKPHSALYDALGTF